MALADAKKSLYYKTMRRTVSVLLVLLSAIGLYFIFFSTKIPAVLEKPREIILSLHPLSIESLRKKEFPGSELVIEETLKPGSNYSRYIASYQSEGLKIFGLLTVPQGKKPETGWPVIIFNHGYIAPTEYRTTERYTAYTDAFSRNGYMLFRPDYRGHGNSEGDAEGGYGSNAYTVDVLNALSSVQQHKDADPHRIGMWGHSMGGFITLRSMVVSKNIKAGVIWGGVVGSHADLLTNWRRATSTIPATTTIASSSRRWRNMFVETFGSPEANPTFWSGISANAYLRDVSGPIALHHATGDETVPYEFSKKLYEDLQAAEKTVEYFEYKGDNHNISNNFTVAMNRSVAFFDKYVKNATSTP